jgi:hypothetical protein
MEEVRLELSFGKRKITGNQIIKAMERIVDTRLVRYSKSYHSETCFVIGCRGDNNSQAGDAWIEVDGVTVISPTAHYRSLTIINHSWIEDMKNPWSGAYFKTPERKEVVIELTNLLDQLKNELKIK